MNQFSGQDYVKIMIANACNQKHLTFKERINWFNTKFDTSIIPTLNQKKQYIVLNALNQLKNIDKPTGYMIELDASASGISLMTILMKDPIGANNLFGSNQVKDVYTLVTAQMNKILGTTTQYQRNVVKKAIMTVFYGSEAKPKEIFGENTLELIAFYDAVKSIVPGAWNFLQQCLTYIQPVKEYTWELPDNFQVKTPVIDIVSKKIEIDELDHNSFTYITKIPTIKEFDCSLPANIIHSIDGFIVREVCRRCNYNIHTLVQKQKLILYNLNKKKNSTIYNKIEYLYHQTNFVSLVGIDYINANNIILFNKNYLLKLLNLISQVLRKPSFELLCIHDAFRCHPNYGNIIRNEYKKLMIELSNSSIIQYMLTDFQIDKKQDITSIIDKSEYLLN